VLVSAIPSVFCVSLCACLPVKLRLFLRLGASRLEVCRVCVVHSVRLPSLSPSRTSFAGPVASATLLWSVVRLYLWCAVCLLTERRSLLAFSLVCWLRVTVRFLRVPLSLSPSRSRLPVLLCFLRSLRRSALLSLRSVSHILCRFGVILSPLVGLPLRPLLALLPLLPPLLPGLVLVIEFCLAPSLAGGLSLLQRFRLGLSMCVLCAALPYARACAALSLPRSPPRLSSRRRPCSPGACSVCFFVPFCFVASSLTACSRYARLLRLTAARCSLVSHVVYLPVACCYYCLFCVCTTFVCCVCTTVSVCVYRCQCVCYRCQRVCIGI